MAEVELILEKYKFSNFKVDGNRVIFRVNSNTCKITTEEDEENIKKLITENLGKWEYLVKTGFQLFYELGIIQPPKDLAQIYKQPFGIEPYEYPSVEWDNMERCIWVSIAFTQEEHEKRRENHSNPIMQVEEIVSQLNNIPKWQAFEKAMKNIKGIIK